MSNAERRTANSKDCSAEPGRARSTPDKLRLPTSGTRNNRPDNPLTPVSPPHGLTGKRTAEYFERHDSEESTEEVQDFHRRGDSLDSNPSTTTPILCLCQKDPKIPRPRNAFILYRQHHAANLIAHHQGISNPEISRIIGDQWRNQPTDIKDYWKALAEDEKQRHQQQYPNYRYQPKRNGKKGGVNENTRNGASSHCHKCGGRSMVSPSTPLTTQSTSRPMLPPPTPSSISSNNRYMPPFNSITLQPPPQRRRDSRGYVNLPPANLSNGRDYADEDYYMQYSPEAKRRRFAQNGGYAPVPQDSQSAGGSNPYPMSPYGEGFAKRHVLIPEWSPGPPTGRDMGPLPPIAPNMAPPPRPGVGPATPRPPPEGSLVLPPIQMDGSLQMLAPHQMNAASEPHSSDALARTIRILKKITTLGHIAPPLRSTGLASHSAIRGGVIAVEGDDPAAVADVVHYLEDFLGRDETYDVRVADGPTPPPRGRDSSIRDFLELITEWHGKSSEMIRFITTSNEEAEEGHNLVTDHRVEDTETYNPTSSDDDKMDTSMTDADRSTNQTDPPASLSPATDSTSPYTAVTTTSQTTTKSNSTAASSLSAFSHPHSPPRSSPHSHTTARVIPVILLHTYHLAASNAYSAAIPITDTYSPNDHWQWVATMWRGTVGADITVYVRDAEPEEMSQAREVDVRMEARCIVVRREKITASSSNAVGLGVSGVNAGQGQAGRAVEEKTLRRLGFEIGEWARGFGTGKEMAGYRAGSNKAGGSFLGSGSGEEAGSEGGSDR